MYKGLPLFASHNCIHAMMIAISFSIHPLSIILISIPVKRERERKRK